MPDCEIIIYLWVSMIIMTSFTLKSKKGTNQSNMLTNCHNTFTETLDLVFDMARSSHIHSFNPINLYP